MPQSLEEGFVEVIMPAHPRALVLARLEVAAIGRMIDLDVDEIADLRLAIEELALLVLSQPRTSRGRLHLTFEWGDATLGATFHVEDDDVPVDPEDRDVAYPRGFSSQILSALVDEHGVDGEPGSQRAWLRKKRPAS